VANTLREASIVKAGAAKADGIVCGVDVSAATLDARVGRDGAYQRFQRTSEGITALGAFARQHQADLVVMEATGGYERLAFAQLWAEEGACAVVNPRQVRRFADAMGRLEKTDRIDCGMIAWFAETKGIKPTPPASETQAQLAALVLRLRQLTETRVEQHNQRRLVTDAFVLASFTAVIATLTREIKQIEAKIAGLIDADPLWTALDTAWREVKGVADRTVARLMAEMPEIGTLSGKAAAKLAGLAPIARDSGTSTGPRPVRGGREGVRSILFIVASVVRRFDPDFKAMSERMTRAGKPKKVILVALAHKLLTRLNAKARDVRAALAEAARKAAQAERERNEAAGAA